MFEVLTKEEAEWRRNHEQVWIQTRNDILVDFDKDIANLSKTDNVTLSRAWKVPEIGKKVVFRHSDKAPNTKNWQSFPKPKWKRLKEYLERVWKTLKDY